jgi:hypothetical protein
MIQGLGMDINSALTSRISRTVSAGGITLIELLLAIALVVVIATLALPVLSNYTIRSKVGESMDFAEQSKVIVVDACKDENNGKSLQEILQEYNFIDRAARQAYIRDIRFDGTCTDLVITVITRNTGQLPDPVLTLTLNPGKAQQPESWHCSSINTPKRRLPGNCQG